MQFHHRARLICGFLLLGCARVSTPLEASDSDVGESTVGYCPVPDPDTLERRAPRTCVPECRWTCVGDLCDVPEEVTVGHAHTCSLRTSGRIECWGANDRGQLGVRGAADRERAVTIESLACVLQIDAGDAHTCALLNHGGVVCWGANDAGQLGDGSVRDREGPSRVSLSEEVVEIAAGGRSSCARTSGGGVVCWGAGPGGGHRLPVEIRGVDAAIDIDVGEAHACAVRDDGRVVCWGSNTRGQLGDGTSQSRAHGAFVDGLSNIISVHTGHAHTCAIDDALHAICWGANESFQLGDGTSIDRRRPFARHPSVIAIGGNRTCGRFAFGQVGCWGEGFGSEPVLIEHLEEAGRVAIAETHGCAVHLVGVPRCWGDNARGQLGDGTRAQRVIPVDTLAPIDSE